MHPIINGDERLVPLHAGETVSNAPKNAAPQFFPQPVAPVRPPHVPVIRPQLVPQAAPLRLQPVGQIPIPPVRPQKVPALPPVPQEPVAQIDFWAVVAKLKWVDREDNVFPTANPQQPSQKWTFQEWQAVQIQGRVKYDAMMQYLDRENFWGKNGIAEDVRPQFVWHAIARGEQVYRAIMDDASFGCGYIDQACGFIDFMRVWA